MMNYIGYSLVDITETNVLEQTEHNTKERNQQRNWESVIQVINFRITPVSIQSPVVHKGNIDQFRFGAHYKGEHNVWAFSFDVDKPNIFMTYNDPCGILHMDFDNVPIVLNLNETANIPSPMFFLNPITRNIYFEINQNFNK